jgi:hypothetical protein
MNNMNNVHRLERIKYFHIPAWPCDQAVQPAFYLKRAVLFIKDTISTVYSLQLILMMQLEQQNG